MNNRKKYFYYGLFILFLFLGSLRDAEAITVSLSANQSGLWFGTQDAYAPPEIPGQDILEVTPNQTGYLIGSVETSGYLAGYTSNYLTNYNSNIVSRNEWIPGKEIYKEKEKGICINAKDPNNFNANYCDLAFSYFCDPDGLTHLRCTDCPALVLGAPLGKIAICGEFAGYASVSFLKEFQFNKDNCKDSHTTASDGGDVYTCLRTISGTDSTGQTASTALTIKVKYPPPPKITSSLEAFVFSITTWPFFDSSTNHPNNTLYVSPLSRVYFIGTVSAANGAYIKSKNTSLKGPSYISEAHTRVNEPIEWEQAGSVYDKNNKFLGYSWAQFGGDWLGFFGQSINKIYGTRGNYDEFLRATGSNGLTTESKAHIIVTEPLTLNLYAQDFSGHDATGVAALPFDAPIYLKWTTTGADECKADPAIPGTNWKGVLPVSSEGRMYGDYGGGYYNVGKVAGTYKMTCSTKGNQVSKSVVVTYPAPGVGLQAQNSSGTFQSEPSGVGGAPIILNYNSPVVLKWHFENVKPQDCRASASQIGGGEGGGEEPLSGIWDSSVRFASNDGTKNIGVLNYSLVYSITCANANGSDTDSVTVRYPGPIASISSPATVDYPPGKIDLTWSARNVINCRYLENGGQPRALEGLGGTINLVREPGTYTFELRCNYRLNSGNIGSISGGLTTTTVNSAVNPVSSCTFTASPSIVLPNKPVTLTWNCQGNVSSCSINNGVGSVASSGSTLVSPSQTTTYTLTCDNLQQPVSTTVKVYTTKIEEVTPGN